MKTEAGMEKPTHRERTRFERIQLPRGQLSVVLPLPEDLPLDFVDQLIREKGWEKRGKVLGGTRKPRLIYIGALPVVRKRSRLAGRQLKGYRREHGGYPREIITQHTPSAQMALVDKAKERYKKAYGKDLPVEEPIAFYIDKETTQKYTFYRYHEEIKPQLPTEEGRRIKNCAKRKVREFNEELEGVRVDRYETGKNYLIVEDPNDEDGIGIVLIDTEFWTIEG